ncbi:TIGR03826 family flagellar region protein [Anoxybacillus sp. FSL W8-1294]|uniref:TIGR03826 family flagellar region protein n=1 Tax=Anoxybacillus sp. FSL W8-1294 TaxID=2954655 RepID=UPI0030CDE59C
MLDNCPKCGSLFVRTQFRDVCEACYKEEEKLFEKVYAFIRKRENRTATMSQVVDATGVEEALIIKWIKKGWLQLVHFPNLGYPCEKCGATIREGRLCSSCISSIQKEMTKIQQEEERQKQAKHQTTYFTVRRKDD